MATIKRINPKSLARVLGVMYLLLGLFFSALVLISMLFEDEDRAFTAGIGVIAFFLIAFLYGALGWIGGYISAVLYNFVAKHYGGVEFEIENREA